MGQTATTTESLESRIVRIQTVCKSSASNIFHGLPESGQNSTIAKDYIETLCTHVTDIVDSFTNNDQEAVDLRQELGLSFLKETIPLLVEIFLRRKTLR